MKYLLLGDLCHIQADCIINQSQLNENFEGMLWQLGASIPHGVTKSSRTASGEVMPQARDYVAKGRPLNSDQLLNLIT